MKYAILFQIYHNLQFSKSDDNWHIIKEENNIIYKWRVNQNRYQLLIGEYTDIVQAKSDFNKLYVSLFYNYIYNILNKPRVGSIGMLFRENIPQILYEHKHYCSGAYAAIHEIEDMSEIENMKLISGRVLLKSDINNYFDFNNLFSDDYFNYSEESNHYLYVLNLAHNINDDGLKMTLLCGLLEKISIQENKSDAVVSEIERLISMIDKSKLSDKEYEQLKNYLNDGKRESARQRCIKTINKYANDFVINGYDAKTIVSDAYSIRSAYSHGDNQKKESSNKMKESANYMFYLMLHIVNEYFKEKQQER